MQITVQDKNDSPPVFTSPRREVAVTEDLPPGSEVVRFTASDADLLGSVSFSLLHGDAETFRLRPESGALMLLKALDRETRDEYTLTVRASDGEQNTDQTFTLQVRLRRGAGWPGRDKRERRIREVGWGKE